MTRVVFRPSVAADFLALQGAPPIFRSRCITALVDDRLIGVGGLVHTPNGVWASVLMNEEARRYPAAIHRAGLKAISEFKRLGLRRVYASADPDPKAERWLLRLGFCAEDTSRGKVFVWRPHS